MGAALIDSDSLAIRDLETQIRDSLTSPRRRNPLVKNPAKWNTLTSSLDTLGDTELAITAYIASEESDDPGLRYLHSYGILQVLFVQQDAAKHIVKSFGLPFNLTADLKSIRGLRNASVGHPTRNGAASHAISRISMSKSGFRLMTAHDDGTHDFQDVDIAATINMQRKHVKEVLESVMDALEKENAAHRAKFKDQKLADLFKGSDYAIGKISEGCSSQSASSLPIAQIAVKTILDQVSAFKEALKERDELNEPSDLGSYFDEVEYPLKRLDAYLSGQDSDLDSRAAYIFAYFARDKVRELNRIASDFDKEYLTDPAPQNA